MNWSQRLVLCATKNPLFIIGDMVVVSARKFLNCYEEFIQ